MDKTKKDDLTNINNEFDIKNPSSSSISPDRPKLTRTNGVKSFIDLETGEGNEDQIIEMVSINCNADQNNSESPDSTVSQTTSSGSSDNELLPTNLFSELEEIASPLESDIGKRIVNNYDLRMMANLPENNENNREFFKRISIITPTGLYQFNGETQKLKCIINASELELSTIIFKNAHLIDEPSGISVYEELTLRQLNKLETDVRSNGGFTVIGYSINEEVFLKLIGLGLYQYPPEPDAYPSEVLKLINKPLSRDISISLRSMVQSYIVFNYLMRSYFEFNNQTDDAYYQLSIENTQWFLLALSSMFALNMLLLRGGFIDKERVSSVINRSVLIESSMIGAAQNWMTYPGLFLPPSLTEYGFLPALAYGFYCGRFDENELFTLPVINVSTHTASKTITTGLSYALTAGSLWSLGFIYPINDLFFFNKNMNDPKVNDEFVQALMIVQYTVFIGTLIAQMSRYPLNDRKYQTFGRYSSNIINGLSYTLLDSAAASIFVAMVATLIFGNNPSPGNKNVLEMAFTLLAVIQIYTFMTTFATTKDLPEYSIEKLPPEEDSMYIKIKNSISNLKTNASLFFSNTLIKDVKNDDKQIENPIHSML